MSDLNKQLLPCPFCGGQAQDDFIEDVSYIIECYVCETTTGCQDSAADAIAAWNRRAPAAAPAPVASITELPPEVKTWLNRFANALSNERIYGESETASTKRCREYQAKTEAARNALEDAIVSALAAVPAAAPVVQPVAWIRFRSDGGYEGPIVDAAMEDVRKKSGAWTPLYAASTAEAKDAARYRWLRNKATTATACVHDPRGFRCFYEGLDEVVDAAIASSTEGEKA